MNSIPSRELGPGDRLGRFTIRNRLGVGGMAEVYLAEQSGPEGFRQMMAIKRIRPHLLEETSFVESFISEARLGGYLKHTNIVQTYEFLPIAGSYLIVMEYVSGISLARLLRYQTAVGRRLPLAIVMEMTKQICSALTFAHAAKDPDGQALNVIHRDLKPDNILLTEDGVAKVSDFGIARAASNVRKTTMAGNLKGTIGYMSPEQASAASLDFRTDLYSLGIIVYEMLLLEPLYPDQNVLSGLRKIQDGAIEDRLEKLEEVPQAVADIVRKALQRDVDLRFQSAAEMRRAVVAAMAGLVAADEELGEIIEQAREYEPSDSTLRVSTYEGSGLSSQSSDAVFIMADSNLTFPDVRQRTTDQVPKISEEFRMAETLGVGSAALEEPAAPLKANSEPVVSPANTAISNVSSSGSREAAIGVDVLPRSSAPASPWVTRIIMAVLLTIAITSTGLWLKTESVETHKTAPLNSEVKRGAEETVVGKAPADDARSDPTRSNRSDLPLPAKSPDTAGSGATPEPGGVGGNQKGQPATNTPAQTEEKVATVGVTGAATPGDKPERESRSVPKTADRANETAAAGDKNSKKIGALSINSQPFAYVWLDGKKLVRTTPLVGLEVTEGTHTLRLETEDGMVRELPPVHVSAGESKVLDPVIFGP